MQNLQRTVTYSISHSFFFLLKRKKSKKVLLKHVHYLYRPVYSWVKGRPTVFINPCIYILSRKRPEYTNCFFLCAQSPSQETLEAHWELQAALFPWLGLHAPISFNVCKCHLAKSIKFPTFGISKALQHSRSLWQRLSPYVYSFAKSTHISQHTHLLACIQESLIAI